MAANPLRTLTDLKQSIWLDNLNRAMLDSGELARLIREDGVTGITSNPAIFHKAITGGDYYDNAINSLAAELESPEDIYRELVVQDIQRAADLLFEVYEKTDGGDGYVSLEVSPYLAHDTEASIAEAWRLWNMVRRNNLFIKIPATTEGLRAIRQLTAEGLNVNITLLFGLPRYAEVADSFIAGLEDRMAAGMEIDSIASVASFFLSRIDTILDPVLTEIAESSSPAASDARSLVGEIAIASAKTAYQMYKEIYTSRRFLVLARKGAQPQKVLWASTSTKNPKYSDVKYVDALIGPDTINTMPGETLAAYGDHGKPAIRLEESFDRAANMLLLLGKIGIDLNEYTRKLEEEGIVKFKEPYDRLLAAIDVKRKAFIDRRGEKRAA
jgi:transaldolase